MTRAGWLGVIATRHGILLGLCLLAALTAAGSFAVDGFMSVNNIRSMLLLAAFLGLASLGQTMCALLGGLNLSIPYVIGAANIMLPASLAARMPALVSIVLLLAGGLLIGL